MDSDDITRLAHDWFTDRVNIAWGVESTQVREGRLLLGCFPRDDASVALKCGALAHEMGHFIEIDDRRAAATNFGLYYKRKVVFPPTKYSSGVYPDPRTCQGVLRECRVIAIQSRILSSLGWTPEEVAEDTASTIRALDILPDWGYVPRRTKDLKRAWCLRKVEQAQRQWSIERVRAEWWRKVVLVTKRLERRRVV